MGYPESVLTKSKSGETEVRVLLKKGQFVEYQYMDPKTGEILKNEGTKLILKSDNKESYFLVPLKQKGKFLMIQQKSDKKDRKVWDGKKAVDLY